MLTSREKEILEYTAAGLSAKEIADHIHRSEFTVQKTICNVKAKTGLQKSTELVAFYFCNKSKIDFADFKREALYPDRFVYFRNPQTGFMIRVGI